jgi:hypothetical protein
MRVNIFIAASFPFVFEMRVHKPVFGNLPEGGPNFWQNIAGDDDPVAKWAQTF